MPVDPLHPSDQGLQNFSRDVRHLKSMVRRGPIDNSLVIAVIDTADRLLALGHLEYMPSISDYQHVYDFVVERYQAVVGRQGVSLHEVAKEFTSGNYYVAKGLLDALSSRGLVLTLDHLSPGSTQLWYPLHMPPKDT